MDGVSATIVASAISICATIVIVSVKAYMNIIMKLQNHEDRLDFIEKRLDEILKIVKNNAK